MIHMVPLLKKAAVSCEQANPSTSSVQLFSFNFCCVSLFSVGHLLEVPFSSLENRSSSPKGAVLSSPGYWPSEAWSAMRIEP